MSVHQLPSLRKEASLRKEPLPSGVAKGCVSFRDDDDEAACLSAYYRLRGWDAFGRPEVKA